MDFFFSVPRNCQWCRPRLTYSCPISTSYFNHLSYFPEQSFQVFFPDASVIKVFIHTNILNCPITVYFFFLSYSLSLAWQFLQKTLFRNCFWNTDVIQAYFPLSDQTLQMMWIHLVLCFVYTTVILLKYFNFFFLITAWIEKIWKDWGNEIKMCYEANTIPSYEIMVKGLVRYGEGHEEIFFILVKGTAFNSGIWR